MIKGNGCKISPPDERDYKIENYIPIVGADTLPDEFMLDTPFTLDQEGVNSCVSFTLAQLKKIQEYIERDKWIDYSPSFLHCNMKDEQYKGKDGRYPREILQNLLDDGICELQLLTGSYEIDRCPPLTQEMFDNAKYQKIEAYARCETENVIKSNIMFNGGVLVCIPVVREFSSLKRDWNTPDEIPIVPLPSPSTLSHPLYNHAILLVGWKKTGWIIQNSWSDNFGKDGLGILPYEYPLHEAWSVIDKNTPPPNIQTDKIELQIDSTEYLINDKKYQMDVAPFIHNNRTFVPIRFVAQACGYGVNWIENERKINILNKKDNITLYLDKNKNHYEINGEIKFLHPSEQPLIKDNRTFIPLRIVMESLKRKVEWVSDTRKIIIY